MKTKLLILILLFWGASVLSAQSIRITSPNGDENLVIGELINIRWHASGTSNPFKVSLWKDGLLVANINTDVHAGNGDRSLSWRAGHHLSGTAGPGTGYQIKVKEKTVDVADMSDRSFSLSDPLAVTITRPMETGAYSVRGDINIEWSAPGVSGNIRIDMVQYDGANSYLIRESLAASASPLTYTIPDTVVPGTYRIKISQGSQWVFSGRFGVLPYHPPGIEVREPLSGVERYKGSNLTIMWGEYHLDQNVRIDLMRYGRKIGTIAENRVLGRGYYHWNTKDLVERVKLLAGGGYYVRVCTLDDRYCDRSDGTFTLKNPEGIWIFRPQKNDVWDLGSLQQIRWNITGGTGRTVRIDLLVGSGTERRIYRLADRVDARSKMFLWRVGSYTRGDIRFDEHITDGCKIKILRDDGLDPLLLKISKKFKIRKVSRVIWPRPRKHK